MASRIALWGGAAAFALAAIGCGPTGPSPVAQMQRQVAQLEDTVAQLQRRVANQQETIESQRGRIAKLQQVGPEPVRLAPVEGIRFARLSGGYDADGDASDDGVVVYIQPYDADGDTIKVAGELTVRVFDLAGEGGPKLIRECSWNREELRKIWAGRFMTNHYTARCPWPEGFQPPRSVTVQARFVDYLTGETYTEQAVFEIRSTDPTG